MLYRRKLADSASHLLVSFAIGALLGVTFFDLLPEALEEAEGTGINIFAWVLTGFMIFFILERFLHWFHHHHEHKERGSKPVVPLIVLGDSVHNFIDGLVVGGAFLIDIKLGVVTALATAAHEIPQEVGDFGILLSRGVPRKKVFFYNFISALTTIVGALLVYFLQGYLSPLLPIFLALTAGFFIYISASDLVPEIHEKSPKEFAFLETAIIIFGAVLIAALVSLL